MLSVRDHGRGDDPEQQASFGTLCKWQFWRLVLVLGLFVMDLEGEVVAVGGFLGACFGVSSESQASSPGVLTTPISSYVYPA